MTGIMSVKGARIIDKRYTAEFKEQAFTEQPPAGRDDPEAFKARIRELETVCVM